MCIRDRGWTQTSLYLQVNHFTSHHTTNHVCLFFWRCQQKDDYYIMETIITGKQMALDWARAAMDVNSIVVDLAKNMGKRKWRRWTTAGAPSGGWPVTDRGGGASLLPHTTAGGTGSGDDDNVNFAGALNLYVCKILPWSCWPIELLPTWHCRRTQLITALTLIMQVCSILPQHCKPIKLTQS